MQKILEHNRNRRLGGNFLGLRRKELNFWSLRLRTWQPHPADRALADTAKVEVAFVLDYISNLREGLR